MIDELQCEGWIKLLEQTLCHMTQRISAKQQEYISKQGDDIVPKVKAILGTHFIKLRHTWLLNLSVVTSTW